MLVDQKDGRCRSCDGQLQIVDADDATMEVECLECDDGYTIETDALNDGGVIYYPQFMAKKMQRSG